MRALSWWGHREVHYVFSQQCKNELWCVRNVLSKHFKRYVVYLPFSMSRGQVSSTLRILLGKYCDLAADDDMWRNFCQKAGPAWPATRAG